MSIDWHDGAGAYVVERDGCRFAYHSAEAALAAFNADADPRLRTPEGNC